MAFISMFLVCGVGMESPNDEDEDEDDDDVRRIISQYK